MRSGLILAMVLLFAQVVCAATGHVVKVLPHFVDTSGRISLSPSLFERDAYQAHLAKNPDKRGGLRFSVQWKVRGYLWAPVKVRVQLRGTAEGNLPKEHVMEELVRPRKFLSRWTDLDLLGVAYKEFGEVTAWRVTLWEGDQLLGEQKSFLW